MKPDKPWCYVCFLKKEEKNQIRKKIKEWWSPEVPLLNFEVYTLLNFEGMHWGLTFKLKGGPRSYF